MQTNTLYKQALNIEVFTAYDLALQYFIANGNTTTNQIKDLYRHWKPEFDARIGYIRKNGLNAEQIAERLIAENEYLNIEEQDYSNAVIDIINTFTSRTQMANDLINRYTIEAVIEEPTEEVNFEDLAQEQKDFYEYCENNLVVTF